MNNGELHLYLYNNEEKCNSDKEISLLFDGSKSIFSSSDSTATKPFIVLDVKDLSNTYGKNIFEFGIQNSHNKFILNKKNAENGIAEAQFELAEMYYIGEGTLLDLEAAFYWYKKSAVQGFAKAQFRLGKMYYYGEGINKNDKKEAAFWIKNAYENGLERAKELWEELELWKY